MADLDMVKIFLHDKGQIANTEHITQALKNSGYDVARGSLPNGQFEYVVLNEKALKSLYDPRGKGITTLLKKESFDTPEIIKAQQQLTEARGKPLQGFFEQRIVALREETLARQRITDFYNQVATLGTTGTSE